MTLDDINPKSKIWIGRGLSGIPVLMLLASAGMKLANAPGLDAGFDHLGLPLEHAFGLGILELSCTLIYLIPRSKVLGAILLTGYLGGATLAHVRVSDPFYTQPLLGAMLWGGLYLRDARLRTLLPFVNHPRM